MNTRLLRRVAKHIAEEPRRFQMGTWYQSKELQSRAIEYAHAGMSTTVHEFPRCGTAACIGGWACILSGINDRQTLENAEETAAKLLRIKGSRIQRLFGAHRWPDEFKRRYMRAKTPQGRVKIAIARIEHFIKTKGAE